MPPPSRATTAGRVYNDLRNTARRERRSTDELLVLYVLERFLFRLSRSAHHDKFIWVRLPCRDVRRLLGVRSRRSAFRGSGVVPG